MVAPLHLVGGTSLSSNTLVSVADIQRSKVAWAIVLVDIKIYCVESKICKRFRNAFPKFERSLNHQSFQSAEHIFSLFLPPPPPPSPQTNSSSSHVCLFKGSVKVAISLKKRL